VDQFTIEELEALIESATPGPWLASHRHFQATIYDDEMDGLGLEIEGPDTPQLRGQFRRSADARLIAAAPELAAQLLALLKESDGSTQT
jgi:hypothetical protein